MTLLNRNKVQEQSSHLFKTDHFHVIFFGNHDPSRLGSLYALIHKGPPNGMGQQASFEG